MLNLRGYMYLLGSQIAHLHALIFYSVPEDGQVEESLTFLLAILYND